MRIAVPLLLMLASAGAAATPAETAAVIECMRANLPRAVRIQTIEVTAIDREGKERVLKGRVFGTREKNRVQVMARIDEPRDLSGAAFLVREADNGEEMYLYLPSANRVKRLTGQSISGKLWGTDFSYDEFKQVYSAFSGGPAELTGKTESGGRSMHVLKLSPSSANGQAYDSIRVHVDEKTCAVLGADFQSGGTARKRLSAPGELKQAGPAWYPSEILLEDLMEGTRTRLRVIGVTESEDLSVRYFSPQQFYLAR